jgi:hypothetical protein
MEGDRDREGMGKETKARLSRYASAFHFDATRRRVDILAHLFLFEAIGRGFSLPLSLFIVFPVTIKSS